MITLGVRELSVAAKFHEEGPGFSRMESPPGVASFMPDGSWRGLFGRDALAADAMLSPDGCGFESLALAHNQLFRAGLRDAGT